MDQDSLPDLLSDLLLDGIHSYVCKHDALDGTVRDVLNE